MGVEVNKVQGRKSFNEKEPRMEERAGPKRRKTRDDHGFKKTQWDVMPGKKVKKNVSEGGS